MDSVVLPYSSAIADPGRVDDFAILVVNGAHADFSVEPGLWLDDEDFFEMICKKPSSKES